MLYNSHMRKMKIYLETTIFNMSLSDQAPQYRDASLEILKEVNTGLYEAFTSELVIQEINRSPKQRAEELLGKVHETTAKILEGNSEIVALANDYVKEGLIPEKYFDDALHIAIASYYEIDVILSWNFEHMVKLKTKKGVVAVNVLKGYKPIEILTPLEVD
jgi:predicted nucleic acid-binding protein